MSNFDFLTKEYPELAKLGSLAEELIDTDAASCLSKLRLITEFIAKDIYYKYFNEKSKLSQFELLKALEPEILRRELSPLEEIKDNYPKFLLTLDQGDGEKNGIKRLNVLKWLVDK